MSRTPGRIGALRTTPDRVLACAALQAFGVTLSWSTGLGVIGGLRPSLERTNFHGRAVSLRGGVGAAAGSVAAGRVAGRQMNRPTTRGSERVMVAAVVPVAAAGAAGLVDDLDAGAHDGDAPAKGLAGHLGALSRGRLTTGVLKIAMIGSGALVSGALMARRRCAMSGESESLATAADAAISAMAIATWTNVHNLLDLRPGRALKTAALLSGALLADGREGAEASRALAAGGLGVVAAALPEDLMENTMLGDTGANAVGAVVGTALAAHPSRTVRGLAALVGTALVLASERVSFTRVIDRTPVLAALDGLGRRVS